MTYFCKSNTFATLTPKCPVKFRNYILNCCICNTFVEMSVKIILHVHHGDYFQKIPNLVYGVGEMKKVECDIDYLSADNIKGIVIELGYSERKIKQIYYRKPKLAFEDSLVSIESDEEVCELIVLSQTLNMYPCPLSIMMKSKSCIC